MKTIIIMMMVGLLLVVGLGVGVFGDEGGVVAVKGTKGRFRVGVGSVGEDRLVKLPVPFGNVVRGHLGVEGGEAVGVWFNRDASEISLRLPGSVKVGGKAEVLLETAEKSEQYGNGVIVFSALDSKVVGKVAKLETHPGNHRIGFWSNANDYVTWDYKASRPGKYEVELTYSVAGGDGTKVAIEIGDKKVEGKLKSTGSWYRYTTMTVGRVYVAKSGKLAVAVKCLEKKGGAVMNLKAVILRPSYEGKMALQKQGRDGVVELHSKDSTVRGVLLRYEPEKHKNTLGYWANAKDTAYWEFEVGNSGVRDVEVFQGCGKGHGGSEVAIEVGGKVLKFVVEDTGHFQNFVRRKVGRVMFKKGERYRMTVRPIRKAKIAVMDLRWVRLLPVAPVE